ncbi:MAG: trypsin-like serine protease [Paracoccaceae bacterium]
MRSICLIFVLALACLGQAAGATESPLRQLQTANDDKGWEGVGRLNLGNHGFCTGALIAPDLVLTAAHCVFDKATGKQLDVGGIEFLAGLRNGRAEAYRGVREGVVHPRYRYEDPDRINRVAYDLALLRLERPIRLPGVTPFATAPRPRKGDEVAVVSYAQDRAEAPALQDVCHMLAGRPGILMLSCKVNFGSSGSPVFIFRNGTPEIVAIVSSKAEVEGKQVALSSSLDATLAMMKSRLDQGIGVFGRSSPFARLFSGDGARSTDEGGAKFVRP